MLIKLRTKRPGNPWTKTTLVPTNFVSKQRQLFCQKLFVWPCNAVPQAEKWLVYCSQYTSGRANWRRNFQTTTASIWCTLSTQVADAHIASALVTIQLASTTLILIGNHWLIPSLVRVGTLSTGFWSHRAKFVTYHKHVPVTLRTVSLSRATLQ